MRQINFYQTSKALMDKTIFALIEKCYLSAAKALVFTSSAQITEHINKLLWTFSQKKFIPHGSDQDDLPQKQPIYISNELNNLNGAQVLIIIDQNMDTLDLEQAKKFEKIIFIYDRENNEFTATDDLLSSSKYREVEMNYYTQSDNGNWSSQKT